MEETKFERYFTLEEAAGLLPEITETFNKAHAELGEFRDQIVLYKRFQQQRELEGSSLSEQESEVLHQKWHGYESCFNKWVAYFIEKGILLRDLDKGLIDFPYHSATGEDFLLCWQFGEDGLFYFHDLQEGFVGRKPVSLLPD